jgi:hypothetical protein
MRITAFSLESFEIDPELHSQFGLVYVRYRGTGDRPVTSTSHDGRPGVRSVFVPECNSSPQLESYADTPL